MTAPPEIPGVRRQRVSARGVDFHVTEAGEGKPLLVLHGWPSHHYCYRDLLADPPAGYRVIAPDLPGYGWSGPAPHRWFKDEVASDVLSLLDALGIEETLLAGHDWGSWIGHILVLRAPERFSGFVGMSVPHPWNGPRQLGPHLWRLGHMVPMAVAGDVLMRRSPFLEQGIFRLGVARHEAFGPEVIATYVNQFRTPVGARTSQDTYRTFVTKEIPAASRQPELRRATLPIRELLGARDFAVHPSLLSPETALADDYTVTMVPGIGHFLPEEAPEALRAALAGLG